MLVKTSYLLILLQKKKIVNIINKIDSDRSDRSDMSFHQKFKNITVKTFKLFDRKSNDIKIESNLMCLIIKNTSKLNIFN